MNRKPFVWKKCTHLRWVISIVYQVNRKKNKIVEFFESDDFDSISMGTCNFEGGYVQTNE